MSSREFGVVVYGATGYTGRLVCEYLNKQYGVNGDVKWAIAGRSEKKLLELKAQHGADDIPHIVADAADEPALQNMVKQTRVIISTVGPYALYGEPLVKVLSLIHI